MQVAKLGRSMLRPLQNPDGRFVECAIELQCRCELSAEFLLRVPARTIGLRWNAIRGTLMYHYDATTALEELQEDALLPHPVKLRDMILRTQLGPQEAQLMNQEFQEYLSRFGELQKTARGILEKLAAGKRKAS
jgi:hypothetical protein